jgi:transposase
MNFVGIDLHKKTIILCVVNQARKVIERRGFDCSQPDRIVEYFRKLGDFQAVVEATASYEWLWRLLEPFADRLVLAHPKKLRVIAESTRKNDRLDAQVLAEFLALEMIPQAYRPTPRQREHRILVRQRAYLRGRATSVKNRIRAMLSHHNADRVDLFSGAGQKYLAKLSLPAADRFVVKQLLIEWRQHEEQLTKLDEELGEFAKEAPAVEAEARAVLKSIVGVGRVTTDIVISELGDVRRFRSIKQVSAYAGLAPGERSSAGKRKELGISKEGSPLLRWALVEAAWRAKRLSARWRDVFDRIHKRAGRKKAIVAVARRLLGVMVSLLRSGQRYQAAFVCPAPAVK